MTAFQDSVSLPGNPIPIKNIDAEGVFPDERISLATDARNIVSILIQSSRERNRINAKIKGMLDGNKPYDPAKLRNAAQLYRTNVNWLEGSGKLSAGLVPYYDLFSGSTYYADVKTGFGSYDDQITFSEIINEEVTRTWKEWEPFDWNMQLMLNDFIGYGKGFHIWSDKRDWRFSAVPQSRFLFPDGTESFPEKWEVICIRQAFKVNDLANAIRNEDSANRVGWNVEGVKKAIFNAQPRTNTQANTLYDYDFVQQQIKDHDILQGIRCKTVQGAHVYVKEFDGKITHLIVTETGYGPDRTTQGYKDDSKDFLYKSIGEFDSFAEGVCPFIFEVKDGSINGTQGLGHQLFAPMETKNRLLCSTMDLAFMRSGITLQAQTAAAYQKLNLVQIGGFNVIPPDFAVQQSTIMGDMNAPVEANRLLDMVIDNNTGIYRNEGQKEQGNPRTYGEVKLQFMNSTVLSNSAVNRFYSNLDKLYDVCVRRMCDTSLPKTSNNLGFKMAVDFQKRCMDRGVPKEALQDIATVRAFRVSGNGSMFMRQQALLSMQPYIGMLPESGKQNWLKQIVALSTNEQMVQVLVPPAEQQQLPTDQQDLAMLENAAIKINAPVTWTPTQNNIIHCQTHLLAASQAAASLSQGANPMEVLMFLKGIGAHVAFHLNALSGDPARQQGFKIFEEQWKELAKITDKLQAQVQKLQQQQSETAQKQAQAQQVTSAQDPDSQIKIAQAKQDMAIKEAKARQQMAIKDGKMQQDQARVRQDMALKDATTAADLQRQHLEVNLQP